MRQPARRMNQRQRIAPAVAEVGGQMQLVQLVAHIAAFQHRQRRFQRAGAADGRTGICFISASTACADSLPSVCRARKRRKVCSNWPPRLSANWRITCTRLRVRPVGALHKTRAGGHQGQGSEAGASSAQRMAARPPNDQPTTCTTAVAATSARARLSSV